MARTAAFLGLLVLTAGLAGCLDRDGGPPTTSTGTGTGSPYVDERESPIRGLSVDEIREFEEGQGMGFARAAELNGWPGPRHVLDLAAELELTAGQQSQIQARWDAMHADAVEQGVRVLDLYRALDRAFRNASTSEREIDDLTVRLGIELGVLQSIHLRAHMDTKPLLTQHQLARYMELRGYGSGHEHEHAN